ncbi:UBX domain-containing protein 1 [Apiospora rasikravindrae]|uniref:UBX domain-containing protein 1 n=1 Tax=Apiospora rasikravindrae TaxID=990691 RepID=A0ABR1RTU8_9PEZI
MADHDALALQLMEFVPNATPEQATQYLSAHNWDLDSAAASLMADMEEDSNTAAAPESASASASQAQAPPGYTGPRTLDGRPAPQAASSSSRSKPPAKKKGLATLSSIGGGGHDHDDDDSDDDDDDDERRTYAGGEKSGLAVQDPNQGRPDPKSIINDLLAKAKSNARRPESESPAGPSTPSTFRGSGQTLGGEGVASRTIPDPSASRSPAGGAGGRNQPASNAQVQERVLHLWRDGFSIDDGPLRRFDDPENADALRMIQQGRAPVHLMNVRYDEPLDVKLQQHEENFRQLPKVYKPFSGEGRRLGSPVPGDGGAASAAAASTAPAAAASSSTSSSAAATSSSAVAVDDSQPTIMIRIQMPDGTRLPARFNTTHTVNDVYEFIVRSSPELRAGGWVLATTFPNKDHTEKELVLGDMAEFKKGGTAMVKRT